MLAGVHGPEQQHALFSVDFNQIKAVAFVTASSESWKICADAFFSNDTYVPRPRPGEVLNEVFTEG